MQENTDLLRKGKATLDLEYETLNIRVNLIRGEEINEISCSEPSKGFLALIEKEGIKIPIAVRKEGEHFRVIDGNKRVFAFKKLGIELIPARVYAENLSDLDIISIQIISNIFGEKRDAIWEGYIYLRYMVLTTGVDSIRKVIKLLMWYRLEDDRCTRDDVSKINTLLILAGKKSTKSIEARIRLLLLPDDIKEAVLSKQIGLTIGYALAENVEKPNFESVCQIILQNNLSVSEVKNLFNPIEPYSHCEKAIMKMSKVLTTHLEGLNKEEALNIKGKLDSVLDLLESSFETTPNNYQQIGGGMNAE